MVVASYNGYFNGGCWPVVVPMAVVQMAVAQMAVVLMVVTPMDVVPMAVAWNGWPIPNIWMIYNWKTTSRYWKHKGCLMHALKISLYILSFRITKNMFNMNMSVEKFLRW